ncbi:hypothetical protein FOJ82_14965 [Tessaracoccus rhinocerotis]|uniref:Uncharacterized protein n=1 Tax=Tessaracoccus rhinocerotis TaxID=1689449 RepID=A0A553JW83_9ACTN|nr:hypothetical protein [Tessaracoccus rhinocerotis]TRY16692.1 hypothetical protein FOJ82_14965 [Tessaracoccus rhinocerotis]
MTTVRRPLTSNESATTPRTMPAVRVPRRSGAVVNLAGALVPALLELFMVVPLVSWPAGGGPAADTRNAGVDPGSAVGRVPPGRGSRRRSAQVAPG